MESFNIKNINFNLDKSHYLELIENIENKIIYENREDILKNIIYNTINNLDNMIFSNSIFDSTKIELPIIDSSLMNDYIINHFLESSNFINIKLNKLFLNIFKEFLNNIKNNFIYFDLDINNIDNNLKNELENLIKQINIDKDINSLSNVYYKLKEDEKYYKENKFILKEFIINITTNPNVDESILYFNLREIAFNDEYIDKNIYNFILIKELNGVNVNKYSVIKKNLYDIIMNVIELNKNGDLNEQSNDIINLFNKNVIKELNSIYNYDLIYYTKNNKAFDKRIVSFENFEYIINIFNNNRVYLFDDKYNDLINNIIKYKDVFNNEDEFIFNNIKKIDDKYLKDSINELNILTNDDKFKLLFNLDTTNDIIDKNDDYYERVNSFNNMIEKQIYLNNIPLDEFKNIIQEEYFLTFNYKRKFYNDIEKNMIYKYKLYNDRKKDLNFILINNDIIHSDYFELELEKITSLICIENWSKIFKNNKDYNINILSDSIKFNNDYNNLFKRITDGFSINEFKKRIYFLYTLFNKEKKIIVLNNNTYETIKTHFNYDIKYYKIINYLFYIFFISKNNWYENLFNLFISFIIELNDNFIKDDLKNIIKLILLIDINNLMDYFINSDLFL